MEVSHYSQTKQLSLLVVKGQGPALLGRHWMNALTLDWHAIHCMQNNQELDKLLQKHRLLFQDELSKLQGVTVKLHVDTSTHPKFCKARAVPLALQKRVEAALDKLEAQGVIEKVKRSNFLTGQHLLYPSPSKMVP